jgi:hypothetical protein
MKRLNYVGWRVCVCAAVTWKAACEIWRSCKNFLLAQCMAASERVYKIQCAGSKDGKLFKANKFALDDEGSVWKPTELKERGEREKDFMVTCD